MNINHVKLHHIQMNLKSPFSASNATYSDRDFIIVEVVDQEGRTGWGEGVAFSSPWYTEETVKTSWHMLEDFLIPLLFKEKLNHPTDLATRFSTIRRNHMAKASIEAAVWDLYAKINQKSLSDVLGGVKSKIEAGVAVGLAPLPEMLKTIEGYLAEGYKRIKVKIKPGSDVELVKNIRNHFHDVQLMVDANSAYSLSDMERLKALDDYNLLMIEQPLAQDDIIDHAKLQAKLKTSICLDESITSYEDARKAIELGSCRIINVKMGRVSGLTESKRIHDLCLQKGIPVWCGGMLETGIGRAHNIALSSLGNFSLPGDLSASSRYWHEDIIEPEVTVRNGKIDVPIKPGIGFKVSKEKLIKYTLYTRIMKNK